MTHWVAIHSHVDNQIVVKKGPYSKLETATLKVQEVEAKMDPDLFYAVVENEEAEEVRG